MNRKYEIWEFSNTGWVGTWTRLGTFGTNMMGWTDRMIEGRAITGWIQIGWLTGIFPRESALWDTKDIVIEFILDKNA